MPSSFDTIPRPRPNMGGGFSSGGASEGTGNTAPGPPSTTNLTAQRDPYMEEDRRRNQALYNETYNTAVPMAQNRSNFSVKMNELRQLGGMRGGQGTPNLAALRNLSDTHDRNTTALAADLWNQGLGHRERVSDMLSQGSSASAADLSRQLGDQLGQARLGLERDTTMANLDLQRQRVSNETLMAEANALAQAAQLSRMI